MTSTTGRVENSEERTSTWRFPRAFWTANTVELFERAAYYGTFIALVVFLTSVVGFTDIEAGWIGALFASGIYLLPFFSGAVADRLGFRASLMLAFFLLTVGYGLLGLFPYKTPVLLSLLLVMIGGSFVKPIITGTVAKSSDAANRARAYSLFYMIVNIGSFTGKTFAKPIRTMLGLDYIPLYSALMALTALCAVFLLYRPKENGAERPQSAMESLKGMLTVISNLRFLCLIFITAGFWAIQGQLYASMPKYVIRMVGVDASPEWYANVNPFVVVLLVVPITHLVRRMKPELSIGISLGLIPFTALTMALSGLIHHNINIFGYSANPITVMMIGGIALQGVAECFLSPKYLEYASKQAPPGQEGLYLGYSHLNTFFAWLFGFIISGYLLDAYCPNPAKLARLGITGDQFKQAYAHAPYLWYVFAGIGFFSFLCLLVFLLVTKHIDSKK